MRRRLRIRLFEISALLLYLPAFSQAVGSGRINVLYVRSRSTVAGHQKARDREKRKSLAPKRHPRVIRKHCVCINTYARLFVTGQVIKCPSDG